MQRMLSEAELHKVLESIESDSCHDLNLLYDGMQIDRCALFNQVAMAVARLFIEGQRDFHYGDAVMWVAARTAGELTRFRYGSSIKRRQRIGGATAAAGACGSGFSGAWADVASRGSGALVDSVGSSVGDGVI